MSSHISPQTRHSPWSPTCQAGAGSVPGRPGEEAALVKPTCLQRSRRIRLARGRVELCGQLGSAVTFPSIRSKLMIAPDPLPSGHRAAASAGSGACGAGEEHTAASLWAWAGGRSAQQAGSGSWTNRASGGDCVLGVSPWAGACYLPWAETVPSPVSPTVPGCPGHGTFRCPWADPLCLVRSCSPTAWPGGWAHCSGTAPVPERGGRSGAGTAKSRTIGSVARQGNGNQTLTWIGLRIKTGSVCVSEG